MLRLAAVLLWLALESALRITIRGLLLAGKAAYRAWTSNKVGEKLFPRLTARIRQWRIRRKMRSWDGHHLDETAEDFNSTSEVRKPMALDLGTRTSTNAGVAGLAVLWLCQLVEQFLPGLLGANADDYLIVAVAWLVARFSKTPDVPKVL